MNASDAVTTTDDGVTIQAAQQVPPIGPHPGIDAMLLGALLWAEHTSAVEVLAHLADDDLESLSAAAVLTAIRTLADAGNPTGPQLVLDELRRTGAAVAPIVGHLKDAVTSGAEPLALRAYAAAAVAASLRRRVASTGAAFAVLADTGIEADIVPMATRAIQSINDCGGRLAALRGESA